MIDTFMYNVVYDYDYPLLVAIATNIPHYKSMGKLFHQLSINQFQNNLNVTQYSNSCYNDLIMKAIAVDLIAEWLVTMATNISPLYSNGDFSCI